jgi:hypothetical protein
MAEGRRGQIWFILGLLAAVIGILFLMRHSEIRWLAYPCFAATAYFFHVGNQERRRQL